MSQVLIRNLLQAKQVVAHIGSKSGLDPELILWSAKNINAIEEALADYNAAENLIKENHDKALRTTEDQFERESLANALNWSLVKLQSDKVGFYPGALLEYSKMLNHADKLELTGIHLAFLLNTGILFEYP